MIYSDQVGNIITLHNTPRRIVSIVPSQTEYLHSLGLEEQVVGITKFCVHPQQWFQNKTRVGGTKKLHIDAIRALQPDIIFANKEENTKEEVELLQKEFPCYISDIKTIDGAIEMMMDIGKIVGKNKESKIITNTIIQQVESYTPKQRHSCIYLIWKEPYMATGVSTFIHEMLSIAGFDNMVKKNRYPEITIQEITKLNPEIIFLSSEPYPFKQKHIHELQQILPNTKIILADGEIMSWYGSRLLKAIDYFAVLHEQVSK